MLDQVDAGSPSRLQQDLNFCPLNVIQLEDFGCCSADAHSAGTLSFSYDIIQ